VASAVVVGEVCDAFVEGGAPSVVGVTSATGGVAAGLRRRKNAPAATSATSRTPATASPITSPAPPPVRRAGASAFARAAGAAAGGFGSGGGVARGGAGVRTVGATGGGIGGTTVGVCPAPLVACDAIVGSCCAVSGDCSVGTWAGGVSGGSSVVGVSFARSVGMKPGWVIAISSSASSRPDW
jgi:hypothetical protein